MDNTTNDLAFKVIELLAPANNLAERAALWMQSRKIGWMHAANNKKKTDSVHLTRQERQLVKTAHHEAGHVVMGLYHGTTFDEVTIIPREGFLGQVTGQRHIVCCYQRCRCDRICREADLMRSLAGPEAERRIANRRNEIVCSRLPPPNADFLRAYSLSRKLLDYPENNMTNAQHRTVDAYIRFMQARVRRTFEDHSAAGWKAVDALALALLMSEGILESYDAIDVVYPYLKDALPAGHYANRFSMESESDQNGI